MKHSIKLAAVSYLNTKPLLYGIVQSALADRIELQLRPPAECARMLEQGEVDLALVPVAALPNLHQPRIVSEYCIGTIGAVKTVALFSDRPLEEVEALYLDHHSRTSVELTRILLREHWHLDPRILPAFDGYIDKIGGQTAGLVIGDRSIGLNERFAYTYDLGQAWMDMCGLPFVFAAWVSTRKFDPGFLEEFNEAMRSGLSRIPQLIYLLPDPHPGFDLEEYYTRYISYELDEPKKEALTLFLRKLGGLRPKPNAGELVFNK